MSQSDLTESLLRHINNGEGEPFSREELETLVGQQYTGSTEVSKELDHLVEQNKIEKHTLGNTTAIVYIAHLPGTKKEQETNLKEQTDTQGTDSTPKRHRLGRKRKTPLLSVSYAIVE